MNSPEIEMVEISELKFAEYNPRRALTGTERRQLAKSLTSFGAVDPAVINHDGTIVGGHQRIDVATELGWERFPCVRISLDKTKERQLNLALNKIHGDWELDKLAALIQELSEQAEVDLDASGFDAAELDALIARARANAGLVSPDEVPDPPPKPATRPGDIWLLGKHHRLACGDATNADDVARLLAGQSPFLMITDPPYGCSYDPAWRQREAAKGNLAYAARRTGEVPNDDRCDWEEAWELSPSSVAYVWHGGLHARVVQESLEVSGFELRSQIIWAKHHLPISRGAYHWRHEPCFYAVRRGASAQWVGDRRQTTLWDDILLDTNVEGGHSTQKPVEAMARAIRNHKGDVYDPFVGVGGTIIGAEMEGRRSYSMDISPTYVDIARIRWENFVGKKARLAAGSRKVRR